MHESAPPSLFLRIAWVPRSSRILRRAGIPAPTHQDLFVTVGSMVPARAKTQRPGTLVELRPLRRAFLPIFSCLAHRVAALSSRVQGSVAGRLMPCC